jgi:holo-[acyl-carrier protein] synthase
VIRNLGVDVIEVKRIKSAVDRWGETFLKKIFTDSEIEYSRRYRFYFEHLAARFAAKEAVYKAFGDGKLNDIRWKEIEITNDGFGKPVANLHGNAKAALGKNRVVLSISHTRNYAVANAAIVTGNGDEEL